MTRTNRETVTLSSRQLQATRFPPKPLFGGSPSTVWLMGNNLHFIHHACVHDVLSGVSDLADLVINERRDSLLIQISLDMN